jgi:phosphoglycerol transferase
MMGSVTTRRRALLEASVAALIAALLSLIVFAPILHWFAVGWSGGDMLSTYVNAEVWQGFDYRVTDQFGFPLGMNLNYFPGIDITENLFAQLVTNITGRPFLGINLLVFLTFPLVAFLAYFLFRMTGLTGVLAIALAVVFSLIPFHWGRALGHTYLSTLYSAVTGMALVLLVGSGRFEQIRTRLKGAAPRKRALTIALFASLIVVTAWTGVYYAAFTLILGAAALIWRFAHGARWRALGIDSLPFVAIIALAVIGFLPGILDTRADPPLAALSERLPYESVMFAGNLAVALLPLPQSELPGLDAYNNAVVEAISVGGWVESSAITNHGTWITTAALLVLIIGLILRARSRAVEPPRSTRTTPTFIAYLIGAALLFFIPWGLNYLFAGTVTAQIRAWNRFIPVLLLLFLLGAAAILARTSIPRRTFTATGIAIVVLALTAVDSTVPFRAAYAQNISEAAEITNAAETYARAVNTAIPENCGVLQLPYMAYPEFGKVRDINDYDHFWTSITNGGKRWSYGAVKSTDASIWAAQLPELPTDEQVTLLRGVGFCAIHLDLRGWISEARPALIDNLQGRFGEPVATGFDDRWLLFDIRSASPAPEEAVEAFLHQPMVTEDPQTARLRESALENFWWWIKAPQSIFTLTSSRPENPITAVRGAVAAPACGPRPITLTFAANDQQVSTTLIANPGQPTPFALTLPSPSTSIATLEVQAPGPECRGPEFEGARFVQVLDLTSY